MRGILRVICGPRQFFKCYSFLYKIGDFADVQAQLSVFKGMLTCIHHLKQDTSIIEPNVENHWKTV